MPPIVHGWFAGSPQAGKPVPTKSCGVQLLLVQASRGGHVGRADLDDAGEDLVLLDQLGHDRRRLVRVVRVVLGDQLQLVAVDATVGVDLVEVDLEALGDRAEGGQRPGLGHADPDLEVLAGRQLGGRLGRAVRRVDLERLGRSGPRGRRAARRRGGAALPSSSPLARSWWRRQRSWCAPPASSSSSPPQAAATRASAIVAAARRASVLLFLMLALPLVMLGRSRGLERLGRWLRPARAGTPVAAWARSARTSSAPSGRSRRCHRASRRPRRSAGCRTARWPGGPVGRVEEQEAPRAVAGRDEQDAAAGHELGGVVRHEHHREGADRPRRRWCRAHRAPRR